MDIGKVIRELIVEPDKELIPATSEPPQRKPATREPVPAEPPVIP